MSKRVGRVLAVRAEFGGYLPDWRPGRDYRDNYAVSAALGGGILLDAIHELDYLGWLFGDAEEVSATAAHVSDLAGDTEDLAEVTIRFTSGLLAQVHLDYLQRAYRRNLQIIGESGVIVWDYPTHTVTVYEPTPRRDVEDLRAADGEPNDMYLEEMRHFIRCVEGLRAAAGRRARSAPLAPARRGGQALVARATLGEARMTPVRVIAVVQARLGSTRLPGKALLDLAGRPMLEHVLVRAAAVPGVDQVVLATTVSPEDGALAEVARAADVACVRGSVDDVLDRFHAALAAHPADAVVRITADCPLLDPEVSGRVVSEYRRRAGELDYVSNVHPPTYPGRARHRGDRGGGARARVAGGALPDRIASTSRRTSGAGPSEFRLANVGGAEDLSAHRWTVDDARDLAFVREVYRRLAPASAARHGSFGMGAAPVAGRRRAQAPDAVRDGRGARSPARMPRTRRAQCRHAAQRGLRALPARRARRREGLPRMSGRSFERSMAWLARARRVVPGTSQTLSKGPGMFVEGAYPVFLERGRGSHVWDVDGNEYVDYIMGLASITLGYAYPAITEAVARQLERGSIFSLPHPLEVEVSERLTEIIPCAEMVRFVKTGSEADAAAVRVARAATGRDVIVYCGYTGWHSIGTRSRRRARRASRRTSPGSSRRSTTTTSRSLEARAGRASRPRRRGDHGARAAGRARLGLPRRREGGRAPARGAPDLRRDRERLPLGRRRRAGAFRRRARPRHVRQGHGQWPAAGRRRRPAAS